MLSDLFGEYAVYLLLVFAILTGGAWVYVVRRITTPDESDRHWRWRRK
jgi:hypothetical protein